MHKRKKIESLATKLYSLLLTKRDTEQRGDSTESLDYAMGRLVLDAKENDISEMDIFTHMDFLYNENSGLLN